MRKTPSSSRRQQVADEKAVFATVESANVVPARARIGGTVVELAVKEGDAVKQGQVVATIGDEKLALQMKSLDAQIAGLEAQFAQAQSDLTRAEDLFAKGTIPKTVLDQARTAFNVASNALKARTAERSVIQQQVTEGNVLAPTAGRVLKVPVTTGTVILPGETVATVAEQQFHPAAARAGAACALPQSRRFGAHRRRGARQERRAIRHHQAGLSADRGRPRDRRRDGRRVSAIISSASASASGSRPASARASSCRARSSSRASASTMPACARTASAIDVPVQRGRELPRPDMPDALEILSGLKQRRRAGAAVKLGLSGRLTQATIRSPLTPLFLLAALAVGLIALLTIPREEEPQISVPMVDIRVNADGLKAPDAVELVTKPLEAIIKGIDGVEHVYSQTVDDRVMVTARFLVGTKADDAILRVHEKIRANIDRIPVGIPEPLIVGRGINDVAVVVLTLSPKPDAAARWTDKDLYELADQLRSELVKTDNVGLTYISGGNPQQIRVEPDPEKLALFGVTLQQLVAKVRDANRSFQAGSVRDNGIACATWRPGRRSPAFPISACCWSPRATIARSMCAMSPRS